MKGLDFYSRSEEHQKAKTIALIIFQSSQLIRMDLGLIGQTSYFSPLPFFMNVVTDVILLTKMEENNTDSLSDVSEQISFN